MSELYRGKVVLDGGPTLEIAQKAAIDAAKLQAISTIISRGRKLVQDIAKEIEMRYLAVRVLRDSRTADRKACSNKWKHSESPVHLMRAI
jgi:hypothetical protein